jgi:small subunit ribosomal protein S20
LAFAIRPSRGGSIVPNSKSAKLAVKKSRQLQARNQSVRSAIKTFVKKTKIAIAGGDATVAVKLVQDTSSLVDKAAKHGIIHKNAANRRKSRLTRRLNAAKASAGE